ncbi:hypothetical protein RJ55_04747 [Drechmeria coniospora]|nr:hypothetical protein RJ55_04747 [Drechmeria coniospora]
MEALHPARINRHLVPRNPCRLRGIPSSCCGLSRQFDCHDLTSNATFPHTLQATSSNAQGKPTRCHPCPRSPCRR